MARIHAGEKVEHPDRPFNVKPRGESGHEDVFFRQSHFLLFGMAIDSSVGYLYSEDDICDVSFGEGRIVSMDFITENWYFIRVEY
ncbi:MAG: hypothetical protein FWD48_03540 [Oscillospiraceae bacterium]|nr:hypothetical protein [Oscillospiraceae bacterium]